MQLEQIIPLKVKKVKLDQIIPLKVKRVLQVNRVLVVLMDLLVLKDRKEK